jgi:hypothetical protein
MIDEQESWLARRIGPLEGPRTQTFYVGIGATYGKLGLKRFTDSVTLTDGGTTVDTGHYRLVDEGSSVVRRYESPTQWWTGPYVEATYIPNDEDEVRRVLYQLVTIAADPNAESPFNSEQIGGYSYSKGAAQGAGAVEGRKSALALSLLPVHDAALTLFSISRPLEYGDPVINRAEAQV